MSGIDDSGTPPEVPEEYAAVYRDAYLRALEEDAESGEVTPGAASGPDRSLGFAPAAPDPRGLRALLAVGVLVVLALIAGAVGISKLGGDDAPTGDPVVSAPGPTTTVTEDPKPTARPSAEESQDPVEPEDGFEGDVLAVPAEDIEASCTAPPGVDSAGEDVVYDAANALDGNPATAWRCNGRGLGQTLTLTMPEGTEVAELGLVPGYAKTDPASGVDRYAENNRITLVRWLLDGGVTIEQALNPAPSERGVQLIRVPRTTSDTVTLEVLATERGPRNTTAISEITVAAAAG